MAVSYKGGWRFGFVFTFTVRDPIGERSEMLIFLKGSSFLCSEHKTFANVDDILKLGIV